MKCWAEFLSDVHFACRQLVRKPAFAVASILTLAIGVGATTAIFSAFKTVLLDALPYPDHDRLVVIWETNPGSDFEKRQCGLACYQHWKQNSKMISEIGYMANFEPDLRNFLLHTDDRAQRIRGRFTSAGLMRALGVTPLHGRLFHDDEDVEGSVKSVVISYRFWQRRFGGDSTVIGQTLDIEAKGRNPYQVVGVMPGDIVNCCVLSWRVRRRFPA